MAVEPQPLCYIIKASPHLPYPECCQLVQLCPGDAGYDATKAGNHVIG